MMKRLIKALGIILAVMVFGAVFYLDYTAYRYRFPQVPAWTYFFQGGHK